MGFIPNYKLELSHEKSKLVEKISITCTLISFSLNNMIRGDEKNNVKL